MSANLKLASNMDGETTPTNNGGDSNIGWRDLIDAAGEIVRIVNPPATNPPATTQIPTPAPAGPNWFDKLTEKPAVLIAVVAALGLVLWFALRR